jgi:hypothetical protein
MAMTPTNIAHETTKPKANTANGMILAGGVMGLKTMNVMTALIENRITDRAAAMVTGRKGCVTAKSNAGGAIALDRLVGMANHSPKQNRPVNSSFERPPFGSPIWRI